MFGFGVCHFDKNLRVLSGLIGFVVILVENYGSREFHECRGCRLETATLEE